MSKPPMMIDDCPSCGGKNDIHKPDCPLGEITVDALQKDIPAAFPDAEKQPAAQLALACERIDKALRATPIDIALGALAIIVGRAQYTFQRDSVKRSRNLAIFMASVNKAINMVHQEMQQDEEAREAAQTKDPVRRLQ